MSGKILGWVYSQSEEYYHCLPVANKEEAIEEARAEYDGQGFYLGEAREIEIPEIDETEILENLQEAMELPDGVDGLEANPDQVRDLSDKLNQALEDWLDEHHLRPTGYTVEHAEWVESLKPTGGEGGSNG